RQALCVGLAAEGDRIRPYVNCDMTFGDIDADEAIRLGLAVHHPASLMRARAQTTVRVDRNEPAGATCSVTASNDLCTIGPPAGLKPSAQADHLCNGRHRRHRGREPPPIGSLLKSSPGLFFVPLCLCGESYLLASLPLDRSFHLELLECRVIRIA